MKKVKENIIETIINKMFEIAGYNIGYKDILDRKDDWYAQYTMTKEQEEEWMKWGEEYISKSRVWYKKLASKEMSMINLAYGLKIVQPVSGLA
jgi:hypothetical protein